MNTDSSNIATSISQKYRILREAVVDLNNEVGQFHAEMPIHDNAARNVFSALSRMMALSDQLHMTLSLLGEDVRDMEKATADPVTVLWNQQVEDCLDDWLNHAAMYSGKVH